MDIIITILGVLSRSIFAKLFLFLCNFFCLAFEGTIGAFSRFFGLGILTPSFGASICAMVFWFPLIYYLENRNGHPPIVNIPVIDQVEACGGDE